MHIDLLSQQWSNNTYTIGVDPVIGSKRRIPANQTKPGWGMMKRGQRPAILCFA